MSIDISSVDTEALVRDFLDHKIEVYCGTSDEEKLWVTQMLLDGGANHGSWASQEVLAGKHLRYSGVYCPQGSNKIEYHIYKDPYLAPEIIDIEELVNRYGTTPPAIEEDIDLNDEVSFADVL